MKKGFYKFSKQAEKAISLIESGDKNVFVTGKAGTGKSTLLEHIRLYSTQDMVVLAPTGIAAINVNGDTIHSFFQLKPGFEKEEAQKLRLDEKREAKFKRLKTIAIDEISMVRADLFDAMDIFLRRARKNQAPFGGVQMVFFGDLYQLPPVITALDKEKFHSEYDSPYFFNAQVFSGQSDLFAGGFKVEVIELDKIYRQSDNKFIEILNAVRDNTVENEHLEVLNSRFSPFFVPDQKDKYIHLMTTNKAAAYINNQELKKLKTEATVYQAEQTGDLARNLYPNDLEVSLCVGAQVMFIYNDPDRRWVNGTIGKVVAIEEDFDEETEKMVEVVCVEKSDGKVVEVRKYKWEISKYVFKGGEFERENIGSFTQMPMKLAWAITIHKSQGKTFDKVVIDLGRGSFAHGQTYVALSRCTSLEGLVLKKRIYRDSIIMDEKVKNFK